MTEKSHEFIHLSLVFQQQGEKENLTGCFAATASSTLLRPRLTIVSTIPNPREKYIILNVCSNVYTKRLLQNFRTENQEINERTVEFQKHWGHLKAGRWYCTPFKPYLFLIVF